MSSEHDERQWTPEELAIIRSVPKRWARTPKLTPEQIQEVRRRVDSLTTPWTLDQIAHDFGITKPQVSRIARRHDWDDPAHEPEGTWWLRREREQRRSR